MACELHTPPRRERPGWAHPGSGCGGSVLLRFLEAGYGLAYTLDVFKGSEVPGIPCTPLTFLGCFQNCLIVSKIVPKIVLIVCKVVLKLF